METDEESVAESKDFRFSARKVALTYAQVGDLSYEEVEDFFCNTLGAEAWLIGREKHGDGGIHYHALVRWNARFSRRDCRCFDIGEHHPNIKVLRKKAAEEEWIGYCIKGGDYRDRFITERMFQSFRGFLKKKADFDAYVDHVSTKVLADTVFPVALPGLAGLFIAQPDSSVRKRHWVIYGAPGVGKTYWAERAFPKSFSIIADTDPQLRFDHYEKEAIFLIDDCYSVSLELLTFLCDGAVKKKAMPGRQRYRTRFLPINVPTLVVILWNPERAPFYVTDEVFRSRFNVFDWPVE